MGDSAFYLELFKARISQPPATNDVSVSLSTSPRFKVDSVDAKLTEIGNDAKITLGPLLMIIFQGGVRFGWPNQMAIIELSQGFVDEDNPPPLK